jgi:acyl transferase domain-containing protein/acyl carrier protein
MKGEAMQGDLCTRLSALLGIPREAIDPKRRFRDYGLTSVMALDLLATLSRELGRPLAPTLAWDYPNLDALARYLAGDDAPVPTGASGYAALEPEPGELVSADDPIAVIGLACRFPGAPDADAFWRLLCDGGDAIREVPADRWNIAEYFDADRSAPGKMTTRWGGFLDGIDRFDPEPFGISPREAAQIDPQQRLMLELAWEALEDAGVVAERLRDSRTGVFCGAMTQDYARLVGDGGDAIDEYSATGQDTSIIAARISYTFGLQGPSLVVNTACSSSLVAVHLACQSLRSGESTLALAGGVNALLAPETTVGMTKFGGMSPDGRSKAFDVRANGYVRAEGGGLVVLKRLSRALADGDPIWCVIRGSAVNNDGFSNGLTAPNPRAQEALLRDAYRRAAIAPDAVQYVEAHGTGTVLGDPIEAKSIGTVLGVGRAPDQALAIGSVKTNIGHLEAAAGIAGLIKVALCIRHLQLPGNLHFQQPNPHIPFAALGLRVQDALSAWPRPAAPMIAGISSFGFGGTNSHVIVDEPPLRQPALAALAAVAHRARAPRPPGPERAEPRRVFVFSGNGSQWRGMGRQLVQASPVFRARVIECDRAMAGLTRGRWRRSLLDELCAEPGRGELPVHVGQPLLFAVQLGLAAMWRAWGVEPDAVVGHSVGEVAAACVAGVLDLESAARVVVLRSRLQDEVAGRGAMALVDCPPGEVEELVAHSRAELAVAAVNAPRATVLSGSMPALAAALAALEARGVTCRRLRVDVAYHSPQMDRARDELPRLLAGLAPGAPRVAMMSTVTGGWLAADDAGADYWGRNLRQPVLFARAIEHLLRAGARTFLEISPHPILVEALRACSAGATPAAEIFGSLHREHDAAEALLAARSALERHGLAGDAVPADLPVLLPLSAHSPAALAAQAAQVARWLDEPERSVHDLCFTASVRRDHRAHRLAVVASSHAELRERLAAGATRAELASAPRGPVFVFPGQGPQWAGMGRRLLADPRAVAFQAALADCDRALRAHVPWSVVELIVSGAALDDIDVIQPAIFAVQVALAALWRSFGVVPAAVIGQSMGEVAAAYVAGALELDAAARVIARRSRVLRRICGRGAMALVALSLADTERLLCGRERALGVAVSSSPTSTVISGDPAALREVLAQLTARNVYCQQIQVDVASHSPQVDELLDELRGELGTLAARAPELAMYSTVTGERLTGAVCDAAYWLRNLREPVRFATVVQHLIAEGHDRFLEISPHPVTLHAIEDGARHAGRSALTLPSLVRERDERHSVLQSLGALYEHGAPVAWDALFADGGHAVKLPAYPWDRRSFWIDARRRRAPGAPEAPDAWFYELTWQRRATAGAPGDAGAAGAPAAGASAAGTWIVCADRSELAPALAAAITARGGEAVVATRASLVPAIRTARELRSVIDLAGLELPAADERSAPQLVDDANAAAQRSAAVLGELAQHAGARLWLVTCCAQPAGEAAITAHGLAQAPLWGLGRVAALEHPTLWGGLVDLDPAIEVAAQARPLLDVILDAALAADGDDQLALRGGARLVPRLAPLGVASRPRPPALRGDATYMITGGLGAIGGPLGQWLVDQGARHLVLVGRSAEDRGAAQLASLATRGVEVRYVRADVADEAAMADALASVARTMPALRGVFHAAGALAYRRLSELGDGRAVLAPKVAGAWILHRLTAQQPLDHFVLFSSAASQWGALGMAHYAAANHALDSLAHHRRGLGLPALSVNWGLWAGGGVGAQDGGRLFAEAGVAAMAPARALAALGRALAAGITQATIADVAWQTFRPIYEARRRRPLISTVIAGGSSAVEPPAGSALWHLLAAAPPAERRARLQGHVRALVAEVLGIDRDAAERIQPHDGFFRIGMTSLTATELNRRLADSLGRRLPSTVTLDYPTVDALTDYLAANVWAPPPALAPLAVTAHAASAPSPPSVASADAPPDELSESALLALLAERLGHRT